MVTVVRNSRNKRRAALRPARTGGSNYPGPKNGYKGTYLTPSKQSGCATGSTYLLYRTKTNVGRFSKVG